MHAVSTYISNEMYMAVQLYVPKSKRIEFH